MNYIYDILINFQPFLIDSYEWNKEDDIIHIRKIPLFKVDTKTLLNVIKNRVKIDSDWVRNLMNKTEVFTNKKIGFIEYACLLSDGLEVVAIRLNNNGIIKAKSSLLIDEAMEVLDYTETLSNSNIKYEVTKNNDHPLFKTRQEIRINNFILKELQKTISENNIDKLNYLYLECFGHKCCDHKRPELELMEQLKTNFDDIYLKIYCFFKMTTSK